MIARALLLASALLALSVAAASAHVVSDKEITLLRALPPTLVRTLRAESLPDTVRAEQAWRSLDAAFRSQQPGGGFARSAEARPPEGDAMATVDWAGETCRALVVVTNGPLRKRFQFRYSLLLPKLERVVRSLEPGAAARDSAHKRDAAALLAHAQMFLLADGIYHDPGFGLASQRAIAAARALQREDGAFQVRGAPASLARPVGHAGSPAPVRRGPP